MHPAVPGGRAASAPRPENLTERVYRQLKDEIFSFRLLPGERFTESEVATLTGASRTPVREALTRLQREGFVSVAFRSGWQVSPFEFAQFEQLYDVRIALEVAAVASLCSAHTTDGLDALKDAWLVEPGSRLTDGPAVCALDERFHEQLVEATGNLEMARIHHDVSERLRIVRRLDFTQTSRIQATYEEHGAILASIFEGDCHRAQTLLRRHIEESKAEVRQITLHTLYEARHKQET
ncbi:transcriptional regulator, GntR family [Halopseudomonas xinjiangensis]|uniref:Transcriptional regulator, GntR family n=1 Tax=Halopseudomonas xinjiangensis TaxID=487184 RepID=A0A1H1LGC6_9GAMM|nr:GntR family transcriptional regulator [Halopseudomonas xinjiangensis]SDR73634.1 transcriptional regulator, GntR family [Halopseudomonas xinjiangensis]